MFLDLKEFKLCDQTQWRDYGFWAISMTQCKHEGFFKAYADTVYGSPEERSSTRVKAYFVRHRLTVLYINLLPFHSIHYDTAELSARFNQTEGRRLIRIKTSFERKTVVFQCQPDDERSSSAKLVGNKDMAKLISQKLHEMIEEVKLQLAEKDETEENLTKRVLCAMLKNGQVEYYESEGIYELTYTPLTQIDGFEDMKDSGERYLYKFMNEHSISVEVNGLTSFRCKPEIPHSPEKAWTAFLCTFNIQKVGRRVEDLAVALHLYAPGVFTDVKLFGAPFPVDKCPRYLKKKGPEPEPTRLMCNCSEDRVHVFGMLCIDLAKIPYEPIRIFCNTSRFGRMDLVCSEQYEEFNLRVSRSWELAPESDNLMLWRKRPDPGSVQDFPVTKYEFVPTASRCCGADPEPTHPCVD